MNVYVMDSPEEITGIVESYESIIWNMQFFGPGDFELVMPYTPENDLCQLGVMLVRESDIRSDEFHNVMRVEKRVITFDADRGWILTVSGGGLKKIVGQRIVWDRISFEGENVEDAIRTVITDNIIDPEDTDRAIDDFILDTAVGFTDTFDAQLCGENISDWLQDTCQIYSYGWDVYIKNGKYVFTLIQGTDRVYGQSGVDPVVFSPEFENLLKATYTNTIEKIYSVARVKGEDLDTGAPFVSVGSGSGLDRRELYVDGGSVKSDEIITEATYLSMLQTYGSEELAAQSEIMQQFEGEITQGLYELGVDFFLGDRVEVQLLNMTAKSRIIEMIYSEDAQGSSLIPTFAEWEV